jgi:hypothetical protein
MGTSAVSRNKLSRSREFVMVQDFNCVQLWVSGCNGIANLSWEQERFAKTVTTASAEALAKAEQLTFIVRVSISGHLFLLQNCHVIWKLS